MSEWTHRLQKVQAALSPREEEAIDHIPLLALKEERMSFGKTHVGKTYMEVWTSSPEWSKWFLQHYESSKKLSHRKMIRFIKLMIEETETHGEGVQQSPVPPASHATPKVMMTRPKAKAMPMTSSHPGESTAVETPWVPSEEQSEIHALQARMGNLENALHQILQHLVPEPVETFPTMPIDEEWNDPWNN